MPRSVIRDEKRGWIAVRARGTVAIDDVLHLIATARAPVENRMVPMLCDARAAHGPLSGEDVERAVAAVQELATQVAGSASL